MRDAHHFPTFARWWSWLRGVNYRQIARHFALTLAALTVLAVLSLCVLGLVWNYQRCMFSANRIEYMGSHAVLGIDGRRLEHGPLTQRELSLAH